MNSSSLSLDDLKTRAAPFVCRVMQIEPDWIDYNGHLNMAYYNVVMDRSIDEMFAALGMGPDYLKQRQRSTMTAECHVRYIREVHLRDPVQVSSRIMAFDDKRMHTFQEMRHATEGWLSATSENMTLSIDMSIRKVSPFPEDVAERIRTLAAVHAKLPTPEGSGRRIEIPRKSAP